METAWIKVFILTLTQCIAPAGKMVCQEEVVEFEYTNSDDCERALAQTLDLAANASNMLLDREASGCTAAVRESRVFPDSDSARGTLDAGEAVVLVGTPEESQPDFLQTAHEERLEATPTCDETNRVAPCRIGDIIIEAGEDEREPQVWRQQN